MATRQTHFEKIPLDEIKALIATEGQIKPKAEVRRGFRKKRRKSSGIVSTTKEGVV
jgi:hypothetical protein